MQKSEVVFRERHDSALVPVLHMHKYFSTKLGNLVLGEGGHILGGGEGDFYTQVHRLFSLI